MQIIAHRGFWRDKNEQNSLIAFKRAFENGFGVEMDLRGFENELFISHDIANHNSLKAEDFFKLLAKFLKPNLSENHIESSNLPLAINIKSDGLQDLLKKNLHKFRLENYFCFDISTADILGFVRLNLPFFTRQSEFEKECVFYEKASGVWLDEFQIRWIDESVILRHLEQGKQITIVSPELHRRDFEREWSEYRDYFGKIKAKNPQFFNTNLKLNLSSNSSLNSNLNSQNFNLNLHALNSWHIALCTDFPHLAREFFSDFI